MTKINFGQFFNIGFGFRMEWTDSFYPAWYTTRRAKQPIQQ